jgi:DNA-binding XRE family transcriptional regulator
MAARAMRQDTTLSVAVRAYREQLGFSQTGFATLLGVGWQTIYRWEAGRSDPSLLALGLLRELARRPAWAARLRRREDVERLLVQVGLLEPSRAHGQVVDRAA